MKGSPKKIEKTNQGATNMLTLNPENRREKIDPNFWVNFWDKNHANMGDFRMDAGSTYSWWILKIEKPQ